MVLIASSLLTKTGKVLVSRQFVEISRSRIESLLTAFPKLVGTGRSHTFVETEAVRYVYQPLESLYLLLITSKSSNIIEDLDTLRTFAQVIPTYCRNFSEEEVSEHLFDIVFAFDELVSVGLRERLVPSQLKAAISMDSSNERAYEIRQKQQHDAAREIMVKRSQEIERMKREQPTAISSDSFSSDRMGGGEVAGSTGGGYSSVHSRSSGSLAQAAPAAATGGAVKSKGLTLAKRGTTDALLRQMAQEGSIDLSASAAPQSPSGTGATAAAAAPGTADVQVNVEEKVSAQLQRDGGVNSLEIRGELSLLITTRAPALRVNLRAGDNSAFVFKTHPNLDRAVFAEQNALIPKDPQRPFPLNAAQGVVKWHVQSQDERLLPIAVTCWPAVQDTVAIVTLEYEVGEGFNLDNVVVIVPLTGASSAPVVQTESGTFKVDSARQQLLWMIGHVDASNRTGSLEFKVVAKDVDRIFPVQVSFRSNSTFCDLSVESVTSNGDTPVSYTNANYLVSDKFEVV